MEQGTTVGKKGFRELWHESGEILKRNTGRSFCGLFVSWGIGTVLTCIPIINWLLALLVKPIFNVGEILFFFRMAKGETVSVKNIFDPFREYGRYLWAVYRVGLFVFLWSLLLIIPGIIAAFCYSLTLYLMQDNPSLTAKEAMKQSSRMMTGHKFEYFVYGIIISLIFCGLVFLITLAYVLLCATHAYVMVPGLLLLILGGIWELFRLFSRCYLFCACFYLHIRRG